jgi:hypothetical protein
MSITKLTFSDVLKRHYVSNDGLRGVFITFPGFDLASTLPNAVYMSRFSPPATDALCRFFLQEECESIKQVLLLDSRLRTVATLEACDCFPRTWTVTTDSGYIAQIAPLVADMHNVDVDSEDELADIMLQFGVMRLVVDKDTHCFIPPHFSTVGVMAEAIIPSEWSKRGNVLARVKAWGSTVNEANSLAESALYDSVEVLAKVGDNPGVAAALFGSSPSEEKLQKRAACAATWLLFRNFGIFM